MFKVANIRIGPSSYSTFVVELAFFHKIHNAEQYSIIKHGQDKQQFTNEKGTQENCG